MIRSRTAGTRTLVIGLVAAAVVCGGAAAATIPAFVLRLHARLAPVAGTTAAGQFNGVLARPVMPVGAEPNDPPNGRLQWQLSWKVNISSLNGPASVSLRIRAEKGAAPAVRMLCSSCARTASGTKALTASQASRVADGDAVVVVRARSATLRGAVKAFVHIVRP